MARSTLAWFGIVASLTACRASVTGAPSNPDDGTHEDAGNGAGGADKDAAVDDAGPAGTEAGAGGDAASNGQAGGDLYPLAAGLRWDYRIARGSRPGCDTGAVTDAVTNVGTDTNGATFYTLTLSCGSYPARDIKVDGDTLWVRTAGGSDWYRFMVLPPREGATFAAGGASGASFRWTSAGSVTVPAGTYADCWKRSQVGYDMSEVYCPGVGMVSADYHAWSQDEGYDLTGRSP